MPVYATTTLTLQKVHKEIVKLPNKPHRYVLVELREHFLSTAWSLTGKKAKVNQ